MMALDENVLKFTVLCYAVRVDELFESHVRSRVVAVDKYYRQIKNYRVTWKALFEAFRSEQRRNALTEKMPMCCIGARQFGMMISRKLGCSMTKSAVGTCARLHWNTTVL
jgi:hypothetical protein